MAALESEPLLRQAIFRIFTKVNGLSIQAEAMNYLVSQLKIVPRSERNEAIECVVSSYRQLESKFLRILLGPYLTTVLDASQALVDIKSLERIVKELVLAGSEVSMQKYLQIVDAFHLPKYRLDGDNRNFLGCEPFW